ncbi:hypothetical protein EV421DRAFT_1927581 [Armillaria borealis]|uniref:Uncharacterized protein n=1 Tax=Armillaria borealis TaxID=47425 RepID=A0AA39MF57_9AGAR|nr:hypothetical protein EV421DRAFT_1927581 [Armillaria borealis]
MCRESANQLFHLLMSAERGNSDVVKNFEQHLATQLERQHLFYLEELSEVERIQAERDTQTLCVLDNISKILEVPGFIRNHGVSGEELTPSVMLAVSFFLAAFTVAKFLLQKMSLVAGGLVRHGGFNLKNDHHFEILTPGSVAVVRLATLFPSSLLAFPHLVRGYTSDFLITSKRMIRICLGAVTALIAQLCLILGQNPDKMTPHAGTLDLKSGHDGTIPQGYIKISQYHFFNPTQILVLPALTVFKELSDEKEKLIEVVTRLNTSGQIREWGGVTLGIRTNFGTRH